MSACPESPRPGERLRRGFTSDGVSVLVRTAGSEGGTPPSALQHEYDLRVALHDDWAVMPLELVSRNGDTRLLLRDTGAVPLRERDAGPLAPGRFLALAVALTAATLRMHAAGLVHCALAPDRILVHEDTGRVMLTGFGCALRLGDDATHRVIVDSMAWEAADIDYLAPELGSRMNRRIDVRADLYSLGCIFHELLVGVPPFNEGDTTARLHAHATLAPEPLHRLRPEVPEQLSRLVLRLLEKAPERRYADSAGLLTDLRASEALFQRDGLIPAFPLDAGAAIAGGSQDLSVFVGRDRELAQLLSVHAEVQSGAGMGICWVSGLPGLGKSALLREAVARMATSTAAPAWRRARLLPIGAVNRSMCLPRPWSLCSRWCWAVPMRRSTRGGSGSPMRHAMPSPRWSGSCRASARSWEPPRRRCRRPSLRWRLRAGSSARSCSGPWRA